jgi:hypothetical protein
MRSKFRLGAFIVLLLAVASVAVASASSSSSSSGDRGMRSAEVIRLLAVVAQEEALDLGPQGESVGDQFVFSDDLFRNGKKVGISGVHCTNVRLEPDALTQQCVATLQLPKGQITVQGLATFPAAGEVERFKLAITGGTERYRTAHGEVVVRILENDARLTLRIIR